MKDVLDSIKERVANPLIFSFLASWLIANWRIIIGLFWFDSNDINRAGYYSLIDFIEKTINLYNGFVIPFFCAIGYVIFNPIVKNLIRFFYAWTTRWGERYRLSILRESNISINKYISLKQDLDNKTAELVDFMNKETDIMTKVNDIRQQLILTQKTNNSLTDELKQLRSNQNALFNIHFLNGYWVNRYELPNGEKGREEIFIDSGSYSMIGKFNEQKKAFDIVDFVYNPNINQIFFIKVIVPELYDKVPADDRIHINRLKLINNDLLVGLEDGKIKIEYRKKIVAIS
ncbi:MAG: hypothetical protein MUC87_03110 [Bacteroidia bacterium]|nr:hypothetical protein [Bacteroidia bacterium]